MLSQIHLAESPLSQQLLQLVLSETADLVKLLSPGNVEGGPIFDKVHVFFEIFGAFRVVDANAAGSEQFRNILERTFIFSKFVGEWLFIWFAVLIKVDLNVLNTTLREVYSLSG